MYSFERCIYSSHYLETCSIPSFCFTPSGFNVLAIEIECPFHLATYLPIIILVDGSPSRYL